MPEPEIGPLFDSVVIKYFNTDDGIWLHCAVCGWEVHLGFEPTVGLAVRHVEAHTHE